MQYQNSASTEELAKSPHGLQRKPATSRLIFADVWQPNRKGWRKYHSSLPTYFFFLKIFGAQGTAPSSLDSFTQLVIVSSNFYARFLYFSRETTLLVALPGGWGRVIPSVSTCGRASSKKKEKKEKKEKRKKGHTFGKYSMEYGHASKS